MKGAALFTLDWLVTDSSGHLVTAPSTSPENDFYYDRKKGYRSFCCHHDGYGHHPGSCLKTHGGIKTVEYRCFIS